ncbi:peptidoglycan-binding protein [Phaeobacter sp. HF9A]|uniref:peptidoglycan-binding protein n=1 Tax=Phaeobacter sp. HF9A TaxID=2721561 RepID=UPI0034C5FEFC
MLKASALVLLSLFPACTETAPFAQVGRPAPPGAPPGTCWDLTIIPARITTVTEQVMVTPPVKSTDGRVLEPAVFASETRQQIETPRHESYFETPCPDKLTPEYISSLQRALSARGYEAGPVTGSMTRATRAAIRAYQAPLGIDSASLSLQAARALGLSAVELPD